MNAETLWNALNRFLVVVLLAAAFLLIGGWYLPLIKENEELHKVDLRLEKETQEAEARVRQKKAAINALQSDPKTVERLAREQLGLAKPGETVIHFEPPVTNPPALRR